MWEPCEPDLQDLPQASSHHHLLLGPYFFPAAGCTMKPFVSMSSTQSCLKSPILFSMNPKNMGLQLPPPQFSQATLTRPLLLLLRTDMGYPTLTCAGSSTVASSPLSEQLSKVSAVLSTRWPRLLVSSRRSNKFMSAKSPWKHKRTWVFNINGSWQEKNILNYELVAVVNEGIHVS